MQTPRKRLLTACVIVAVVGSFLLWRSSRRSAGIAGAAPTNAGSTETVKSELSMADVLEMASAARQHMTENLDDYTARFVQQEVDTNGVLGEETEMLVKVQTRLRGDTEEAPIRVYLHFQRPEAINGREVIWAQDLYEGKMAVHEVGLLGSLKTFWLDPNGLIAMRGQRYPISEIGLVKLVEKLIERGELDRDSPDVKVTLTPDQKLGDVSTQLITVRREKPSQQEGDFSLAEVVIDPQRQLILSYRAFGWPAEEGQQPPLLESYTYYDVQTNVGLSDADFDPSSPNYKFPAL